MVKKIAIIHLKNSSHVQGQDAQRQESGVRQSTLADEQFEVKHNTVIGH